jgi:hypothetical protein
MAVLQTGQSFASGDQVTATKLEDIANLATFRTGANQTADGSTIEVDATGGYLKVPSNGIGSNQLSSDASVDANRAVETNHIKDDSVTYDKIQNVAASSVIGNTTGSTATPTNVAIIDDDTMATASATSLATSESIKAYVDAEVGSSGISVWDSSWVAQDNQSSPTSLANSTTLTFSHTLGVLPKSVTVYVATNSLGSNSVLMHTVYQLDANNVTSYHRNCTVQNLSSSSLDIRLGGSYFDDSQALVSWGTANTHIRVIALG